MKMLLRDLQRASVSNYGGTQASEGKLPVQSVSIADGLQKAVNKLTEEMYHMRMEMKELYDHYRKLRECVSGRREWWFPSPSSSRCSCACGERGCIARSSQDDFWRHSSDQERWGHQGDCQGQESQPMMACSA